MQPSFINPAIHTKCTTEREIRDCKAMKARAIRFLMKHDCQGTREAGYPVLQLLCWMLDEDCPPLAWFPYPEKRKKTR